MPVWLRTRSHIRRCFPKATLSQISVSVGTDDGYVASGSVYTNATDYLSMDSDAQSDIFCWFLNVVIPGSKIVEAYVLFQAYSNHGAVLRKGLLSCEAALNPVAPVDRTAYYARSRTVANVAWDSSTAWTTGTVVQSPSLVSVIQEVRNQSGWSSPSNIGLFLEDNGTTSGEATVFRSRDLGASVAPILVVRSI